MKTIALILIALQCVGCVYHQITIGPRSTADGYREATALMQNKNATVIFQNESKVKAERLEFKLDSLIYVHLKTGQASTVPLPNVNRVVARNPRPYIRNGAIYGAIPGALLGLLIAVYIGNVGESCDDCEPHDAQWELILPAGALIGGAIGASFGVLAGASNTPVYTVKYQLDK